MRNIIKIFLVSILLIPVTTGYIWWNSCYQKSSYNEVNTYYVSTTGNDNNSGTFSKPFRTIQKGIYTIKPGDTIYIRGGTYNEKMLINSSGTSNNWITIKNYPNEQPIIDGTGIKPTYWAGGIIQISDASYIIVDGFKVQNSTASGICVLRSNYVTVQNCQTKNTGKSGIRVCYGEGTNNQKRSTNIKIFNNTIALSNTENDQEALTFSGVNYSEIKNNILTSTCKKEGICCKQDCNNIIIAYNDLATPGVSIYINTKLNEYSHDFEVHSNYCHGEGISIAIGMEKCGKSENFFIYNNIFISKIHGFSFIDEQTQGNCSVGPKNVYLINNIFNVGATAIKINPATTQTYIRNLVIRNNILKSTDNDSSAIFIGKNQQKNKITIDHNLFASYSDIYGTDYITEDPKWVNPSGGNYRLQPTSPAIDAGSYIDTSPVDFNGNPRPKGNAIDIGPYEYEEDNY